MRIHKPCLLLLVLLMVASCTETRYPRPRAFPRIELPAHQYVTFKQQKVPFTFSYPEYGTVEVAKADSMNMEIRFPRFGCTWHITYRDFARLDRLGKKGSPNLSYEDYRKLVFKHSQKASEIFEKRFRTGTGHGTFFELYGEVPTSAQFYVTDSSRHALMAAMYFNTALKNDSLAPVIDFMKADLLHMAQSVKFTGQP